MTESCKKAFEYLHEETWRRVRELYRRNGYRGSWQQFYKEHEERVKQDALRLREENASSDPRDTQNTIQ